jgi:hypothetical protein
MITNDQKTSLLIDSQLPEFVRDNPDYANFKLFLAAYYEWMEQNGEVTERTKNLLSYKDIDRTTDEFLDYFTNDFLPYFPQDILIDKQQAVKVARELYQTKGTPASYQFLFRILYNSEFDVFYTKDAVLKASSGTWYVAKSLKLATTNKNFLNIQNYRLFGETTKSIATVENSVISGLKTEVFISNIERLFESGEIVRVVDNNNQDILFDGQPLKAKVVGQVSQIKIDPKNRGLLYQPGDPVIVYNGLNSNTGIGATAVVGETTAGAIQSITVVDGGFGYTFSPNTVINITNGPGANAVVATVNPDYRYISNVAFLPIDTISLKKDILIGDSNYYFSNITVSDANTTLADAFTFTSYTTYPISSVLVVAGGSGITQIPQISATSNYQTDIETQVSLSSLGILAPIQITNGGNGYQANDVIVFSGGNGLGARANVRTVDANGAITNVSYVLSTTPDYPLGGMGYSKSILPSVTVNSANVQASGASLYVPGILGDGATFSVIVDRAGSITTINLVDNGEDYVSTPNVSLKVQDIVVSNVSIGILPERGETIYQGANTNVASYLATVDSITTLNVDNDPTLSLYQLRVFNNNSNPDPTKQLNIDRNIHMNMANFQYDPSYTVNGYKNYGDGTAKANASFLNGLVVSQGQYLTSQGHPSSYDVLQDSIYNNFTYKITAEKEIAKYRDVLLNLLHPTGMKVLGRYVLKANENFKSTGNIDVNTAYPLSYYTDDVNSYVTMQSPSGNTGYNNIIEFHDMNGVDVLDTSYPNTIITFTTDDGVVITSQVESSNSLTSSVTLTDYYYFDSVPGTLTANSPQVIIYGNSIFG